MRHRWIWILFALPLVAGLARLRFDADILNLLPTGLPTVRGLQLYQRHFANANELLITVSAQDPDAAAEIAKAVADRLATQTNLVRSVHWQPPWLDQPADAAENLAWIWLQQPPTALAELTDRLAPDSLAATLSAARETLATSLNPQDLARTSYDPLGLSRLPESAGAASTFDQGTGIFANEDGRFRVIRVEPARGDLNYREAAVWLAEVRALASAAELSDRRESHDDVRLAYTGSPAFLAEISQSMESDLKSSVFSTVLLIAALFWIAHRTWRPLGWLILSLGLTLGITLALGGLFFGTLNVVSVGFAAVLMGLAVDYGLVSYQEAVATPGQGPRAVRHEVSRGIWYSAGTTGGTFLLLGFSGLPGLTQLGQLTAMGLIVGALVMLFFFLPRVCPTPATADTRAPSEAREINSSRPSRGSFLPTVLVLGFILGALALRGFPRMTASDDPLRPRRSAAYDAMDELKTRLGQSREPLRLLFQGPDLSTVGQKMEAARAALATVQQQGGITSFELPTAFWPRPERSATNRAQLLDLASRAAELRSVVLAAGFTTNSLGLLNAMLAMWPHLATNPAAPWPTNATARWLTDQFAAHSPDGSWLALGAAFPGPLPPGAVLDLQLPDDVLVSSWDTLSTRLVGHVERRVAGLTVLIAVVLIGCLWMAFGHGREVFLSVIALALSFGLLLAVMALLGWSWNLLSLVALPLLLGSSVDSTIHVQLALRRHQGDRRAVWRTTGKALLLCAGANIAGFGSLAWSSNLGLASLDLVCAVGVGCVFVVCVGLLPAWWHRFAAHPQSRNIPSNRPSILYGAGLWRVGLALARRLPEPTASQLAQIGAWIYRRTNPSRMKVVIENLRPVLHDNPVAAEAAARQNFRQFARKLVDLWQYEAGLPLTGRVQSGTGWAHFTSAIAAKRGILMVTPHLGNWEFGTILLAQHQIRPLVLTAPEPGQRFTALRAAARTRQGVDTMVVGDDPFAFVEVIRRLQDGGLVALLLDRPREANAVEVEFFGRPFRASLAAAELARATGSLVLPVFIVREGDAYRAHALAPVDYDRRALGERAERAAFTGRILRAFEPAVRQFPDQWFHFVPMWTTDNTNRKVT